MKRSITFLSEKIRRDERERPPFSFSRGCLDSVMRMKKGADRSLRVSKTENVFELSKVKNVIEI